MKPKQYPLPIAAMTQFDAVFYGRAFKLAIELHRQFMDFNATFEPGPQAEISKEIQLERDQIFLSQLQETLEQIEARGEQIKRERRKQTK